jgi:Lrp/AsnC family transcriptional regulator for asnA, asnC and gidA
MKIDNLDKKLILELQRNGRCTYMDLAKMLGVAEGTVRNRLKKLIDGDIVKITAIPDLDKFGYDFMGIVGLQVPLSELRSVAEQLSKNPNVCYLANVTGRYDFIAILLTRSSKEFAYIMETVVSAIPSVIRTETFVTLNIYKGRKNWLDTTHIIDNLDIDINES